MYLIINLIIYDSMYFYELPNYYPTFSFDMMVMVLGKNSRDQDQRGVSLQHHCWTADYTVMVVRFYRNFFPLSFTFQTDFICKPTVKTLRPPRLYFCIKSFISVPVLDYNTTCPTFEILNLN